ncbi:MAG: (2Fe-2S)-binding protein [Clostridiales Family XIII bacterium]|jgi:carbon-monoxide dehydrogenase small subunit|nr:(2Fe-2S)-binding protein [Clostridiales Family XIII bacterium]
MGQILTFKLNGADTEVLINGDETLLDVLRGRLSITSLKCGCNHGDCGACTIHLNGRAAKACTVLAATATGARVNTLESLFLGGDLHPLQKAFIDFNAPQCGYCTPGMLMAASAFLSSAENPSEPEIREALGGNLCRCTGYNQYIEAIMAVAEGNYGPLPKRGA